MVFVILNPVALLGHVPEFNILEYAPKYFFPFIFIKALTLNVYSDAADKPLTLKYVFFVSPCDS